MRFVIFAHIEDDTALRVFATLRNRHGANQVKLVSSEELVYAPHWIHKLENVHTHTSLRLADGASLDSEQLGVVFNRLRSIRLPQFDASSEVDRSYSVQETYAFWLSWLASLPCPVVNPPSPRGLGSQERSWPDWISLAAKAGLPVRGFGFTTNPRRFHPAGFLPFRRPVFTGPNGILDYQPVQPYLVGRQPTFYFEPVLDHRQETVLVTGDRFLGNLAGQYETSFRCLVDLTGCDLIQVFFMPALLEEAPGSQQGDWKVCGITTFPHCNDSLEIEAITDLLETREAGS